MGTVAYTQWSPKGGSSLGYDATQQGLAIITNADGTTNHDSMTMLLQTPNVALKAGKRYQFVLRMKADQYPMGQTINFKPEAVGVTGLPYEGGRSGAWNVSRAGAWEEVYIPVRPAYDRNWYVQVWVSQTTRFATTPSKVFIAPDVDVYELPEGAEVVSLHGVNVTTDKDAFNSSTERIDGLGNIYINQSGAWKHVFPRMIYRDSPLTVVDYLPMFQRYKNYGFTGVMNISDAVGAQAAIDAGLEHLSVNANSLTTFADAWLKMNAVYQWAETNGRQHNIVWYNYDNENEWVGDWSYQEALRTNVDTDHVDPATGKRRHPIYMLNGNVGLPRTYHNASRKLEDFTGSYVGSAADGYFAELNPDPSLLVQFLTQNQRVPVSMIQLQTRIGETFVPSLFYGIALGGRAMSVWRDGGATEPALEATYWAAAFRDDVSPKLDQMLPIIEQPHFTSWKAWTNQFPAVRIGTRELNGTGYLILSSFAASDLPVTVTLQGKSATKAVDMFTGAQIASISGNQFTFSLGHYNNGYRVIKLMP